jgi:hypothetical protein
MRMVGRKVGGCVFRRDYAVIEKPSSSVARCIRLRPNVVKRGDALFVVVIMLLQSIHFHSTQRNSPRQNGFLQYMVMESVVL